MFIEPEMVSVIAPIYTMSGRNLGCELYGEGFTRDYRADVGFFGRTNTNFNSFYTSLQYRPEAKAKILSRHFHNFSWIGYDFQGRIQNWESEFYYEWRLPRNSYFSLAYEPAYERILEEEFRSLGRSARRRGRALSLDRMTSAQFRSTTSLSRAARNTARRFSLTRAQFCESTIWIWILAAAENTRASVPRLCLLGQDAPLDPGAGNLV